MDEIQRWLEANLAAEESPEERVSIVDNLMEESEDGLLRLLMTITSAQTDPWWYDTLVEYARRTHQAIERGESPKLDRLFSHWCIGVAGNVIKRPTHRGRPKKEYRDQLICMAMARYLERAWYGEPMSDSEACALVAEVVGLDDSVVAKIWRRERRRQ